MTSLIAQAGNAGQNAKIALGALQQQDFNLKSVIENMFLVLTPKEKDVITRRFSLFTNKPKETLDRIGRHYDVTRERIRQIENIAIAKLRRNINNTQLRLVNTLAKQILINSGGVMTEAEIINTILNQIYTTSKVDGKIIVLSLSCDADLKKCNRTNISEAFWSLKEINLSDVRKVTESAISALRKHGDLLGADQIISFVQNTPAFKGKRVSSHLIISCLQTDKRACQVGDKWGLMEWRHVNPKSINDKAYLVLKKAKKPLHFVDIANKISEVGFDKKVVTVQAVHNELIRYDQFVLVGRGLYALKEWGYEAGTVSDVIVRLLKEKGPLTKKEIVSGVMEQRSVKTGTISLNLQQSDKFVRVGRAVYDLREGVRA